MSIFGTIMSKIFGDHAAPETSKRPADTTAASPTTTAEVKTAKANTWQDAPTKPAPASGASEVQKPAETPAQSAPAASTIDVAAILDGMEDYAGHKLELDWRHSIVDLMKLLHMDPSHENRKQLATELHYTGDMNDSAAMNMWLHKEVMEKLAESGGKLPAGMH